MNNNGQKLTDILGADGGVLQIGKANWSNGEYFSGLLDNLKIWGKALSDDELGVESARPTTPPRSPSRRKSPATCRALCWARRLLGPRPATVRSS